MATLEWDKVGSRTFETGLDRGVLYYPNGAGVPWNGLISVSEETEKTVEPLYFDGRKYSDVVTLGDFKAKVSAYTYPDEFEEVQGLVRDVNGLTLYDQPPRRFHMSYRTQLGNDVDGAADYKIHILYNLLAISPGVSYQTMSDSPEVTTFEWEISGVPENIPRGRAPVHIAFDTAHSFPYIISSIEEILYGNASTDAFLPHILFFLNIDENWPELPLPQRMEKARQWAMR